MKRRSFLTLLGLAPVVASARPQRPDKVASIDTQVIADGVTEQMNRMRHARLNGINPLSLQVNQITAGVIRSADGKMIIDRNSKRIVISD